MQRGAWGLGRWQRYALLLCVGVLLTSCIPDSTPRVIKIGLIAPFEGLYRHTGYAALDQMRKTLAANTPASTEFRLMPVALDDGGDPEQARRAAQKLLVDPNVRAIIGPLFPQTIDAVGEVMQSRPDVRWLPLDQLWPGQYESELVAAVAEYAVLQKANRLLLAGRYRDAAQNVPPRLNKLGIPVLFFSEPFAVQSEDAVLWLGDPAGAASFLTRLRQEHTQVPFWMGNSGGDPVFAERAQSLDNVYWAMWTDNGFDIWRQAEPTAPPFTYLIYRATQMAMTGVELRDSPSAVTHGDLVDSTPHFQLYQIRTNGVSSPVDASSLPH